MNCTELETVSRELIKPSTPTPSNVKTYKLSLLDQVVSVLEYRTPIVHFYASPNKNGNHIVARFKESLSKTLSLYYPLSGRLVADETFVECKDQGVPFIVARAKTPLLAFLTRVDRIDLLPHFIPSNAVEYPHHKVEGFAPLAVQITVFECGGVAIGSHVLHKVLDGTCRTQFFNTWGAIFAERYNDVHPPEINAANSIFPMPPSAVVPPTRVPHVLCPVRGNIDSGVIVKAFGFTPTKIAALKSRARSECTPNPTRVESVTAFIWIQLMSAAASAKSSRFRIPDTESNTGHASAIIHSVNMRPLLNPPSPPTAFGKFTTHAIAYFDDKNGDTTKLPNLVTLLRKSLSKAKNVEFVSKFQGFGAFDAACKHKQKLENLKNDPSINAYFITSWSGVGSDFGLGSPLWTGFTGGRPSSWFRNFIPLIHTPENGIEAWMILDKQEMAILESDPLFLEFVDPCTGLVSTPKSLL